MSQKSKHIKTNKQQKETQKSDSVKAREQQKVQNPIRTIAMKFFLLTIVIFVAVYYSDHKGLFNPNQANDHTLRKWDSFYDFTKKNNVDILLIGNSHLYTGINPKNLSTTLGANAFILASPGTQISDSYYSLKEALRRSKPSLVVIETYGIRDFDQLNLSKGGLSDQMKSFSARRDFTTKLRSTPHLFSSRHYIHAWSNTLRNHDFIFTNKDQLKSNRKLMKEKNSNQKLKLYLGRYVRFTTGIQDSIMNKYVTEGPRVDGNDYQYNKYTEKYVGKIAALCEKNDIEYMFLTLPMYEKHIKDYAAWRDKISEILDAYPAGWLNMQSPYLKDVFTPMCFEDTYNINQHMTFQGSLIATYMLANYIKEQGILLPERKEEQQWFSMFYGEEGYFENNSPHPNDKRYKVLGKDVKLGDLTLSELLVFTAQDGKSTVLTAKIKRDNFQDIALNQTNLILTLSYNENGEQKSMSIPLQYDILHAPSDNAIYVQRFNSSGIVFNDIIDGRLARQN
jgi:hypothetical protein